MPRVVLRTGFSIPEAVADRQGKAFGAAEKEELRRRMWEVNYAKIAVFAVQRLDAATIRLPAHRRRKGRKPARNPPDRAGCPKARRPSYSKMLRPGLLPALRRFDNALAGGR